MKDLILKKSGIGLLIVVLLALILSSYYTNIGRKVVSQFMPVVQNEVAEFLPITIKGGEIVEPVDTVKAKDYEGDSGKVVLDTRVNEFEPSVLTKPGIYISKKYFYTYNGTKIEIHSLSAVPDMVIDEETTTAIADQIQKYSGKIIFLTFFAGLIIGIGLIVLISTVLMHWLMALIFHVNFGYTLRINILTYAVLCLLGVFAGLSFSLLINFVIMIAANVAVNTMEK